MATKAERELARVKQTAKTRSQRRRQRKAEAKLAASAAAGGPLAALVDHQLDDIMGLPPSVLVGAAMAALPVLAGSKLPFQQQFLGLGVGMLSASLYELTEDMLEG